MPHEIMGWKASNGTMHETWAEAAQVEAVGLMMAMLPVNLSDRKGVAERMAHDLFVKRERSILAGLDGLIDLIKTEPRTKPQLAVDNTKATPRRSWVAEMLTKAGQTSEPQNTADADTRHRGLQR